MRFNPANKVVREVTGKLSAAEGCNISAFAHPLSNTAELFCVYKARYKEWGHGVIGKSSFLVTAHGDILTRNVGRCQYR